MATLMLEVVGRHDSRFHHLDRPVTRIGRALDNDIILPDPSVSPYHALIRRDTDGRYSLHSLADENGIRIGRRHVTDPLPLEQLPLTCDAGRTRLRIHDRNQAVPPTRLISCRDGGTCLFGSWIWAAVLFGMMLLLSAYDNYLSTPLVLSWSSYWRDQVVITAVALGLTSGLVIINRLVANRWEFAAAISFVSLVLSAALLLDQVLPLVNYLFTSPLPGFAISIAWSTLLLPFATAWFLVRLNHGNALTSMTLVVILFAPAAYLQVKQVVTHYDLLDDFSKKAFYSHSLYPWDTRLQDTISIDAFTADVFQHSPGHPGND